MADPEKAISYSTRAAEAATAVFAWEEAVAHYEGILQVLELAPSEDARRCDFLLALGWTLMPPGETQRVIESIAPEAMAIAESVGDANRAAAACRLATEAFHRAGARMMTLTDAVAALGGGLRALCRSPTSIDRVRLDVDYAESFHMSGRESEAWSKRVAAHTLAQRLNAPNELLLAAGFSMYYTQSPQLEAQRLALAQKAAIWSTDGASARTLAMFYLYSAWAFWDWGERDSALAAFDLLKELPTRFRDPFVMEYAVFADGAAAGLQGRLEDAVALAHETVRLSDDIGSGLFGRLNAGEHRLSRPAAPWPAGGGARDADLGLASRRPGSGAGSEHAAPGPGARFCRREGRGCNRCSAQVMDQRAIGPEDDGNVATTDLIPLLETAVLLQDAESAAILYSRLEVVSALVKVHGGTQTSVGRLMGDAALLLGQPAERPHSLRDGHGGLRKDRLPARDGPPAPRAGRASPQALSRRSAERQ